jgi:hypothetical protein
MPDEKDPEFQALPPRVRRQVRVWSRRLESVWNARPLTAAIKRMCAKTGAGYTTAIRFYYKVRRAGHWRALISRRQIGSGIRMLRVPVPVGELQISIAARRRDEIIIQVRRIK